MRFRSLIGLLALTLVLGLVAAGCGSSKSSSSSPASGSTTASSSTTTAKKHHRARNAAIVGGGAVVAHHVYKKHQVHKLHAGQYCSARKHRLYAKAHLRCVHGRLQ